MAKRSLPHASTKYWVDMILTTIPPLECRRFDCEREARGASLCPFSERMLGCCLRLHTRRAEDHLRLERSRMKQERSTAIPPNREGDMTAAYNPPHRRMGTLFAFQRSSPPEFGSRSSRSHGEKPEGRLSLSYGPKAGSSSRT